MAGAGHGATATSTAGRPQNIKTTGSHIGGTSKKQVAPVFNQFVANAPVTRPSSAAQVAIVRQHSPIPEVVMGSKGGHAYPATVRMRQTGGNTLATRRR